MSKYAPLKDFLRTSEPDRIRLSFEDLEQILGFRLPESAYRYPAWWSNNPEGHSHCLAWVQEGWQSEQVDVEGRQVTFRRSASQTSNASKKRPADGSFSLFGALKGTVRIAPGVDLTEPTGEVWAAEQGQL